MDGRANKRIAIGQMAAVAAMAHSDETVNMLIEENAKMPDRLSADPNNPHYSTIIKTHKLEVFIDGKRRNADVQEYCISEGWALVRVTDSKGNFVVEDGRFKTIRVEGHIVASNLGLKNKPRPTTIVRDDAARMSAAEAKRARRREKLKKQMEGQNNG